MTYGIERRRCRRFVIPGTEIKFKRNRLFFFTSKLSKPYTVLNISKGGVAFGCDKKLSKGTRLVVQLLIPCESSLTLDSIVRRQEQTVGTRMLLTGIEFMPFGEQQGLNKLEILDVLRRLDKKYGGDT